LSNSLGNLFNVVNFGESHGNVIGVMIDGCPAGLPLSENDLLEDLRRRRPGQSAVTTQRKEEDVPRFQSGVLRGRTTGAPICITIENTDMESEKYEELRFAPRPGHADLTSYIKYGGFADYRGGGRFSGRITAGYVMAGSLARKLLNMAGVDIFAYTVAIGGISAELPETDRIRELAMQNLVYCPDPAAAVKMAQAISTAREEGDSLGGIIEVIAIGVPAGWGEPVTGGLDSELARAFFAIPAVKGVEIGVGFAAAAMKGSENNDPLIVVNGAVRSATNNSGGILGGISTGMPVSAKVAIKPTPSIAKSQLTVDLKTMSPVEISIAGRHDPCIVPRAVVVVEAVTAIVLCDMALAAGAIPKVIE
jgi:chorismate synthase